MKTRMKSFRKSHGFTLIEVLIVTAISGMLMVSLSNVVGGALNANEVSKTKNDLNREASYAMRRIVEVVSHSPLLMITTNNGELQIDTILDPQRDTDLDGFPDADNDKDGKIDEDLLLTTTGVDNDGDGDTDEDWQDWITIFFNTGAGLLQEKDPFPMDVNAPVGVDRFDKRVYTIATHVTLYTVSFETFNADDRYTLINVRLELTGDNGELVTRETKIRVGSAL